MKSDYPRETFTFDSDALDDLKAVVEYIKSPSKSYAVRTALREYRKLLEREAS